jgi:hypothetical protein
MNRIVEEFRHDEARVLDRLVDGELGPAERRALLAALDDEPSAWRRTALAFLEAQSWRQQLSRLAAEPLMTPAIPDSQPWQTRTADRSISWGTLLAVAASLFVAFGLGTRFPADRSASMRPTLAAATPSLETPAEDFPEDLDGSLLETITLAPADDDGLPALQLSVVKEGTSDEDWASAESFRVSDQLSEDFAGAGLEVTRQQRLWPLTLADGRSLVVPVEEVDIRDPDLNQY